MQNPPESDRKAPGRGSVSPPDIVRPGVNQSNNPEILARLERDPRVVMAYDTPAGITVYVRLGVDLEAYRSELDQEISSAVVTILAMEAPTPDADPKVVGGDPP